MKTKSCLSLFTLSLIALLLMFGIAAIAQDQVAQQPTTSAVPNLIRYGGVLKDTDGVALASQTVGITFALYKQQNGGVALWTETRNVTTDAAGQYNVMLGSTKSEGVPAELFSDQEQRWLAVQVQGQPERNRVLLVSVPYAFKAHEAETLGGLPASAFVKAAPDTTGTGSADSGITVNGLSSTAPAGSATKAKGNTVPPAICTPVPGAITYWDSQGSLCPSNLFQMIGGPTNGYIGIGDTNPSKPLDVGGGGVNGGEINARKWYDIGLPETRILSVTTNPATNPVLFPGSTNLFVGWQAGGPNGTQNNGALNTFTGLQAGFSHNPGAATQGIANTYNGAYAGFSNVSGVSNTMLGANAGFTNTGGYNTFVGSSAGQMHASGNGNTMVGNSAGLFAATGNSNTYLGNGAGTGSNTSNNNGNNNTFTGFNAGNANTADNNSFYGYAAGVANTTGVQNTFLGYLTGNTNTLGSGNTFVGFKAGLNSFDAAGANCCNTFVGNGAGWGLGGNMTGAANSAFGHSAGLNLTTGGKNTFSGFFSGNANTIGSFNTFYGDQSGQNNVGGNYNTFLGTSTGGSFTGGSHNTFVGDFAGNNEAVVNNNIEIGNAGPAPESGPSNQILIGTEGTQTDTYVAGIYMAPQGLAFGQVVCVDKNGKLWGENVLSTHLCQGKIGSSRRFKDHIADMGDSSSKLLQLRPVTFFYKPQYDDGSHSLQYGLIAEEVAKVYPELAGYDRRGQPDSVKYHLLAPMLLSEFQKQHAVVTAQQTEMQALREQAKAQQQQVLAQQREIEGLKSQLQLQNAAFQERLSRLESLLTTRVQTAAADNPTPATTAASGGSQ